MSSVNDIKVMTVTSENVAEAGIFCIKNKDAAGFKAKIDWFKQKCNNGLQIKIALDAQNKQVGFIEYTPAELAWRPVAADNYLFIQCIAVFSKNDREKEIGSSLIAECEDDAKQNNKSGVCTMTSKGSWMADNKIFIKNGYYIVDELDRFELMVKKLNQNSLTPKLINWNVQQKKYTGWNLIYADQCPWHNKSVADLSELAAEYGINLKVKKINSPMEVKSAPSGFGVFSLIKDGELLEDHYLSKTRFNNILRQVLNK